MPQAGPLRVLLICPDPALREAALGALSALGRAAVRTQVETEYPSGASLARGLRTFSPHTVFLSFEQVETAIAVIRFVEAEAEGLPVVGLHSVPNPALLLQALRAGAREFLFSPFSAEQTGDVMQAIRSLLRKAPLSYSATEHIYSFLPAKPGAGTTTVALNVSAALAQQSRMKVLLSDLDLTCGSIRFLMKLPQSTSIVDALQRSSEMDVSLWPQLVSRREGIDLLHSGSVNPHAYFEPGQMQGLIDFARGSYNALTFDLSGNMERHSLQIMEESKLVFLVCNPEPGSLFQAREKIEFLNNRGLEDRVWVILNRYDQALAVPLEGVEQFLGVPVAARFSDDTFWVNSAVAGATTVVGDAKGRHSKLAKEFCEFAAGLVRNSRDTGQVEPSAQGMLAASVRGA